MKLLPALLGLSLLALMAPSVFAAAPDGLGPWADTVVSSTQGTQKNGSPVLATRSDPTDALGVAEGTNAEGTFYSLGFGGVITLGFTNGISSGVLVVEATNQPYPNETASVSVSQDGITFVPAGTVSQDGTVSVPESVDCAKFVRITDTSTVADFPNDADGYDVDGVEAQGQSCTIATPTPTMTPTLTPTKTPTPTPGGTGGCGCKLTQSNVSNTTNVVSIKNKTGKNKANDNNGAVSSTSGNATGTVNIANSGNTNVASNDCCCDGGNTTVTISDNGRNSTNTVNVNKGKKKASQ